ncbi:MAG: hypothetical protein FRX49_08182 [Trebouxia sp. A1-2]|nr:MAG: hypothetical protein FRX49_08182 [Trebouxia sp. A1-2]
MWGYTCRVAKERLTGIKAGQSAKDGSAKHGYSSRDYTGAQDLRLQAWQVELKQLIWAAFLQSTRKTAKKVVGIREGHIPQVMKCILPNGGKAAAVGASSISVCTRTFNASDGKGQDSHSRDIEGAKPALNPQDCRVCHTVQGPDSEVFAGVQAASTQQIGPSSMPACAFRDRCWQLPFTSRWRVSFSFYEFISLHDRQSGDYGVRSRPGQPGT